MKRDHRVPRQGSALGSTMDNEAQGHSGSKQPSQTHCPHKSEQPAVLSTIRISRMEAIFLKSAQNNSQLDKFTNSSWQYNLTQLFPNQNSLQNSLIKLQ